jgi:hypothetical protein
VAGGDGAGQDDGEDRGAERAANLLDRPGDHARVGDLLLVEAEKGDGHHGDGDRAEAEAPDDQPEREQPRGGARPGEGEGNGRGGDDEEAGDGDRARADLVGEPAGQAAREQGADALRDEHDAGRQRRGAAHLLVVERQQEHRAVQREPGEEQHRRRRGDWTAGEDPDVDERLSVPPGQAQRVCGERGGKRHTDRERDDDVGVREAVGAAGVAQPEDDRRDARGEQGEARQVQARPWRSRGRACLLA